MNLSIRYKLFILFVVVIGISVSSIGWYGFHSARQAYIDSALLINKNETKALANKIDTVLEAIPDDVIYNATFYALRKLLVWEGLKDKRKIVYWENVYFSSLKDYIKNKKIYYKVRVIDNKGNEKISLRYNSKTAKIIKIAKSKLQNKSNRYYFKNALELKKGEFYISDLDLNVENGEIEKPYVPVIRYITPIINVNGKKKGIVVLSFYAEYFFDMIKEVEAKNRDNHQFYFLNKEGDYLYSHDKLKQWGTQLGNGYSFKKDYPAVFEMFKNKNQLTFFANNRIYSVYKIYPNKKDNAQRYWYLVSSVKQEVALAPLNKFSTNFFIILFIILILGLILIGLEISKLMVPLSRVTSQLKSLSLGEIRKDDIVYNSKDEIGEIVKSTNILTHSIEEIAKQAQAVAQGNFSSDIKLLGKNDILGLALTLMMKRLKEITKLASSLSVGNYDVQIIVKSSDDELGKAINNMVKYLKNIAKVTETIASGDINIAYKLKSEDDRLGIAVIQMIEYLKRILKQAELITNEDYSKSIEAKSKHDELGLALAQMTKILRQNSIKNRNEIFLSEGFSEFSSSLSGIDDKIELSKKAISVASRYIKASSGAVYEFDKAKEELKLIASYVYSSHKNFSDIFKLGEGVVGQVAIEREIIELTNIKDDSYVIQSATTTAKPKEVYTFPLIHEDELLGVAEIMSFNSFSHNDKNYLKRVSEIFSTALFSTAQNSKIKTLLEESQKAYEELQVQSEELQESNIQMEEQQQQLTLQAKELNEKNENILKVKNEVEKASAYKSEFLANMSHELRTPLNSIILLSKLLVQNKNLDESDIEKSSVIHKAGKELLLLINDILDLSKIESGNMEFEYTNINSSEITTEMNGLFFELAKEKKLKFIIKDKFNSVFLTDKTKLSQVLKNLLSNAFKFTKEGSVTLEIMSNDDNLNFIVKDTGIGIPKDKLALIFEAFKQVDGSISREFGGTGLGLSISKTIVDLMGGVINVQSQEGEGATFMVTLALKQNADTQKSIEIPHAMKESKESVESLPSIITQEEDDLDLVEDELKNKNILIVDDDSRNIFALTSTIESMGGEVYSAFHGEDAIEVLEDGKKIDLILMDIMMPVMDGLKAIKAIKRDDKYKSIPIIAVTAKTMSENKQECLDAGADDYLAKPINHNALISTIRAWVK